MRSRNMMTGIVVGVFMVVLLSAAVVLAGNLEPSAGPTQRFADAHPGCDLLPHRPRTRGTSAPEIAHVFRAEQRANGRHKAHVG